MNTTGELLERVGERFPFPEDAFDRMRRRRDRRRRNQRLVTAAIALILAIAAIGGAIEVFRAGEGRKPASPSITIRNIGDLQIAWAATNGGRWFNEPVVSDGMVYEVANGSLFAYPTDCVAPDGGCAPTWIASLQSRGARVGAAIVDGGHVFVIHGQTLYAFAASCGSNGETCSPLWTARFPIAFHAEPYVVAATAGAVYVQAAGDLYAVSEDCASGGAACHPERVLEGVAHVVATDGVLAAQNDSAHGPGVVAIRAGCVLASTCAPIWRWSSPAHLSPFSLDRSGEGLVFVELRPGSDPSPARLYAFSTACGSDGATCTPSWTAEGRHPFALANGVVFLRLRGRGMAAFSTTCATDGSMCSPLYRFVGGHGNAEASPDAAFVYDTGIKNGAVRAYSATACRSGQAQGCEAIWRAHVNGWVGGFEPIPGGLLARGTGNGHVIAYANDCGTNGSLCNPVWSAGSLIAGHVGLPIIAEGMLFLPTDGRLVALAPRPRSAAGNPSAEPLPAWLVLTAAALLALVAVIVRRIRASHDRGAGRTHM